MRIVTARRVSQVFFFLLFLWFCVVATLGVEWWQLRGWPVNWLLQLDPLVAVATALSTKSLYKGLLWALVTVILTIVLGRFFCGWVCPFGTLHHLIGYLARRGKRFQQKSPSTGIIQDNPSSITCSYSCSLLLLVLCSLVYSTPCKNVP